MGAPTPYQQILVTYIPLLTAHLSVIGSSSIILSIWRGRKEKMSKPQHRLMFGLSVVDILFSIPKAWTFLFSPKGYPFSVPGAQGNMATCRMQGFFIQIAHIGGAYNSALSLYYYLTICRRMKPETFAKYIEPVVHIFFPLMNVAFGIAGVVIKLYNPFGFGPCFIGPYPPGCQTGAFPCELHGDDYLILYEIFAQGWVQLYMLTILVTNLAIWHKVIQLVREMNDPREQANLDLRKRKYKHAMRIAIRSTLYVAAYMISWLGPTLFHIISWATGWQAFWTLLILVILTPLQGFWNAFIYARPQYTRLREQDPEMPRKTAIMYAFFPPTEKEAVARRSTIWRSVVEKSRRKFTSKDDKNDHTTATASDGSIVTRGGASQETSEQATETASSSIP